MSEEAVVPPEQVDRTDERETIERQSQMALEPEQVTVQLGESIKEHSADKKEAVSSNRSGKLSEVEGQQREKCKGVEGKEEEGGHGTKVLVQDEAAARHISKVLVGQDDDPAHPVQSQGEKVSEEKVEEVVAKEPKCVVCFGTMVEVVEAESDLKPPSVQFNELLKVLKISPTSFDLARAGSLPPSLFCTKCGERILNVLQIIDKIEQLNLEWTGTAKPLHEDLVESFKQLEEEERVAEDSVSYVRKTLVQCFSPWKVSLPPKRRKKNVVPVADDEKGEAQAAEGTAEGSTDAVASGDQAGDAEDNDAARRSVKSTRETKFEYYSDDGLSDLDEPESIPEDESDDDYQPDSSAENKLENDYDDDESSSEDDVEDEHSSDEDYGQQKKKKAKKTSGKRKQRNRAVPEKEGPIPSGTRHFNQGKLVAYDCPHCAKTISRSDFSVGGDKYVFKCIPKCCYKITSNFANLVFHHEASCPSKPRKRKSKKRRQPQPKHEYDELGNIMIFECPACSTRISRSDYFSQEEDKFSFQCSEENCGNSFETFPEFTDHHSSHCNPRPKRRKIMSATKRIDYILSLTDTVKAALRAPSIGKQFDASGRVIYYQCPRCQIALTPSDYLVSGTTDQHKFSCTLEECDRVLAKFPNLIHHHDTHCFPQKKRLTWLNYNNTGKLESFHCIVCNEDILNIKGKVEEGQDSYPCLVPDCDRKYKTFSDFRSHHETHCVEAIEMPWIERVDEPPAHSEQNNSEQAAPGLTERNTNQEDQLQESEHTCSTCGKVFQLEAELRAHQSECSRKEPSQFSCSVCCRQFPSEQFVAIHKRFHDLNDVLDTLVTVLDPSRKILSPEGSFVSYNCPHCDKVLSKSECLPQLDEQQNLLTCWQNCCTNLFETFDKVVLHHLIKCAIRQLPTCTVCDQVFPTPAKLKSHVKTHDEKSGKVKKRKTFPCRMCPKKFRGKKSLIKHMKLHIAKRKYKCKSCGGTFEGIAFLRAHEKLHLPSDVECIFCDRMFKSKYDLDMHVKRIHLEEDVVITNS